MLIPSVQLLSMFGSSPNVDVLHTCAASHGIGIEGLGMRQVQNAVLCHLLSGTCVDRARRGGGFGCLQVSGGHGSTVQAAC